MQIQRAENDEGGASRPALYFVCNRFTLSAVITPAAHKRNLRYGRKECNIRFLVCQPSITTSRIRSLQPALHATCQRQRVALRLYIWNARVCESLYLPMQLAEVAARNAIRKPVAKRFQSHWYANAKFINLLPERMKEELNHTVRRERKGTRQHSTRTILLLVFLLVFGFHS
jgi:hypothetical protein